MKYSKGIVCFCDILGYKGLIENNTAIDAAEILVTQILGIKNEVKSNIFDFYGFDDDTRNVGKCFLENNLESLIVSDTIIFFFDFDKLNDDDRPYHTISTMVSLNFLILFARLMFERGLPLRGCIDYGEYCIIENMFTGSTISNCFTFEKQLEFAGILVTENCFNFLMANSKNDDFKDHVLSYAIFKTEAPHKNNISKVIYVLNWFNDFTWKEDFHEIELEKFVLDSFLAHKKSLTNASKPKLLNTIKMLEIFRQKYSKE